MWKTIAVLVVEIIKALYDKFKKSPEIKQKEKDDEKEIKAVNDIANPNEHAYIVRDGDSDWAKPDSDKKV